MAIFSIIDGLISIIFNKENFEQGTINIQIWVELLHNIMIHECYFLGLGALIAKYISILKYCTKNKRKDFKRVSHMLPASFILVLFVA